MNNKLNISLLLKTWWKYFSRISIGALVLLFLFSNIFQNNLWSAQVAYADVNGLGVRFDNQNYSDNLSASLTNTGSQQAQTITTGMRIFHCKTAGEVPCAPDLTPDDFVPGGEFRSSVTLDFPEPGQERRVTIPAPSASSFNPPSC